MGHDVRALDTLKAFYESIGESTRIKNKLLKNINTCEERTVVLNLVWLEYDFNEKLVTIEYYVKDKDYPSIKFSFGDFINLLKKDRHK